VLPLTPCQPLANPALNNPGIPALKDLIGVEPQQTDPALVAGDGGIAAPSHAYA
jgi:hypothetical protein